MRLGAYLGLLALSATALTACRQAEGPGVPTFTLRLEPATLEVRVTETGEVGVAIARSGGFDAPVTVTLAGAVTGLEAEPLVVTGDAGVLRVKATDAATIGTTFPAVRAEGGDVTRTETLTLRVARAVARPSEVTVEGGGGSRQVPQGRGEVRLSVTGENLERATSVSLGGLDVDVLEQAPGSLSLSVQVPHGAEVGAKDLVLAAAGGDTKLEAALEVTPITSGPDGDDGAGAGTPDDPYRTLGRALAETEPGDTVLLLDGVYSAGTGESWPTIAFDMGGAVLTPGPNMPPGVTVKGESASGTVLDGLGAGGDVVGLAFAANGGAADLTLRGFAIGSTVLEGTVELSGVVATENAFGVYASGGDLTGRDLELTSNETGLLALGEALVELEGGSAHDNEEAGVIVTGGAELLAAGIEAFGNGVSGIAVAGAATASLDAARLYDNAQHGLATSGTATAHVTASELQSNGMGGLWHGGANLVMRGTTVQGNAEFGVYVDGTPELVDLGTFFEPGENDLHGNGPDGNGDQLLDARPDRDTLGPIVFTVSATDLQGERPAPDVYVGLYLDSPRFSILGKNNVIQFY